jgi:biopolymer transport protein ExbD
MAEMDTSESGAHKKGPGVKKSKKRSTRIDLTPMVDLGFLLLTFFIFSTTMTKPTGMKLFLPEDSADPIEIKESGALTIMLGRGDGVFYYEGKLASNGSNFKSTNFKEVRDVVINKKKSIDPRDFFVTIKPSPDSRYKNAVDMLDEMKINDVKSFALVDISDPELQLLRAKEGTVRK